MLRNHTITYTLIIESLREAQRRSNLLFYCEIAALTSVTRNDNVTKPNPDKGKPFCNHEGQVDHEEIQGRKMAFVF